MLKFRLPAAIETFLGLGMGLGYLTSLRFFGPVGMPEIFILLALLLLIKRSRRVVFQYSSLGEAVFKSYLVFSVCIALPVATLVTYTLMDLGNGSAPQYILSYILGVLLMFWVSDAIVKEKVNIENIVWIFSISFLLSNIVAIYFFGMETGAVEDARYKGGAKNPNQLVFYAASLSLMIVVYLKRYAYVLLPLVIFVVIKAKSDAYGLMLVVTIVSYFFISIFYRNRLSFGVKTSVSSLFVFLVVYLIYSLYAEMVLDIWRAADEGDGRLSLMKNGFLAAASSPLFGFGSGSFSGVLMPFGGSEAHNTFLDFSTQFGFLFAVALYLVIFGALFSALRRREYLAASFILSFIVSGLFHFSGRHFIFWIELAVFMNYVFYEKRKKY